MLEVGIKFALGRASFQLDPRVFRRELFAFGYTELPVTSLHALEVSRLPSIHKNPFDRLLVAQALAEGVTLLTVDALVAQYLGPIRKM